MKYHVLSRRNQTLIFASTYKLVEWLVRKYSPRTYHYGEELDIPRSCIFGDFGTSWYDHFLTPKYEDGWSRVGTEKIYIQYIVFDEFNRIVSPNILLEESLKYKRPIQSKYWKLNWRRSLMGTNYLGFRNGPIPGVGKKNWHRWKGIKTTQERRQAQSCKYVRPKRNYNNLPHAWDWEHDGCHRYPKHRSWKNTKKKKQWM